MRQKLTLTQIYSSLVDTVLLPVIIQCHGYKLTVSKKIISYNDIFYMQPNVYLGITYDWRDNFLQCDLGNAYFTKDILKRVVIIGDFDMYLKAINSNSQILHDTHNLKGKIDLIAEHLFEIISKYPEIQKHLEFYIQEEYTQKSERIIKKISQPDELVEDNR